jgi:hypothetical protein
MHAEDSVVLVPLEQRLEEWELLADKFPHHPAVLYHLGRSLSRMVDYDGAIEVWKKVGFFFFFKFSFFISKYVPNIDHILLDFWINTNSSRI